mgnify:CR=1 FL=1
MTTSKVKRVESIKEWGQGDRLTMYHNLEMENGDKINIGKKSKLEVGSELNYEIFDTSQEFNKAKNVNPEFQQGGQQQAPRQNNDKTSDQILWSVCLKEATALYSTGEFTNVEAVTGDKISGATSVVITLTKSLFEQSKQELK